MVQAPFVIADIAGYKFGNVSKSQQGRIINIQYPDMIKSLQVVKVNGQLNIYTLTMVYQIAPGRDPNLVDKILSHAGIGGKILFSYGDWTQPEQIFKEEEAIITNVKTSVSFSSSQISYTLTCTGTAYQLKNTAYNFQTTYAKPSDVIKEIIQSKKYGIQDIFKGMINSDNINQLIAGDDKAVRIEAQSSMDVMSYIQYLVSCMQPISSSSSQSGFYQMQIFDDINNTYNGQYFTVKKISTSAQTTGSATQPTSTAGNIYCIDVGYPGQNFVTEFSLRDDQNWSILYKNDEKLQQEQYQYRINSFGEIVKNTDPSITRSQALMRSTSSDESWWTQMTDFPISASITMKGLIRPTVLLSYIYINVVFYGMKHVSSGTYFITKQTDTISERGYSTQLDLTRISGNI